MADYPPPSQILPEFNPAVFRTNDTPLTIAEAENYFLSFPTAQGTENFGTANMVTANVSGTLTAGTFSPTNLVVSGTLSTTNPSSNLGYGSLALVAPTTGINNVAFGSSALRLMTSGVRNTGVGVASGANNLAGDDNTNYGYLSGNYTTNGTKNTFIGSESGYVNGATMNSVTAVGYKSLRAVTGDGNTAIGDSAGLNTTSGSNNTFVGRLADASAFPSATYSTAIGYNSQITASNQIVLGRENSESVRLNYITPMYSALPTLTSADIGYRYSENISFITPSNGVTIYTSTVTLPIGVWLIYLNMSFTGVFGMGYLSISRVTTNVNFGVIPLVQTTNGGGLNAILAGSIVMPILTASKVEISYNGIILSTLTDNGTNDIVYVRLA